MRFIPRLIPLVVSTLVVGGSCFAQDTKAPQKPKPSKAIEKPPVVKVIDLGARGFKIESLRLVESSTACEWHYEITVRNNGLKGFTGTIGLSSFLVEGQNQVTAGSNVLNVSGVGPGKTHIELKPITAASSAKYKQLTVHLTSESKTVDTKTIDLDLHYTGSIESASVESGMVRVAVKNTSAVAAPLLFTVYKADSSAQGGWASAGGRGLCAGPGQTITEAVTVPPGWPNEPKTLKVVLKCGSVVLGEKLIQASPN